MDSVLFRGHLKVGIKKQKKNRKEEAREIPTLLLSPFEDIQFLGFLSHHPTLCSRGVGEV